MMVGEHWAGVGSTIASLMFVWAMAHQYIPSQFQTYISNSIRKITDYFYPYVEINFYEYGAVDRLKRSEVYTAIEAYLATLTTERSKRFKAETGPNSKHLTLSMDDYEEVDDRFRGAKLWWSSSKVTPTTQSFSFYPAPDERRFYRLTFHRSHRKLALDAYIPMVIDEGKAIGVRKRERKLYTNSADYNWYEDKKLVWSHVPFQHPARFDTLAMDADKKQSIIQDLLTFSQSKEYYARIGKPWKRGYLLYGPPGTGKSTMIAAMANLLDYDIYDLELTTVKNNTKLRKLLIETTSKSIIVIEDIDCSLDLSGKRKTQAPDEETKTPVITAEEDLKGKDESKVTLSGLLNFIDGLWSSCGGERLIVFTTNQVEKLDPALVRRGRMDQHIELSYCSFEGFKVLAKNYLGIDSHPLFESIQQLFQESNITPADVAESLMPKTTVDRNADRVTACLESLIRDLKQSNKSKQPSKEEEAATELISLNILTEASNI